MKLTIAVLAATLAAGTALAASAQDIHQRKVDQQARIHEGVRSGELTHREAGRIEHQERSINHEEAHMRSRDNGHLTSRDRRVLNHQQNAESRRILRQKHDAQVR